LKSNTEYTGSREACIITNHDTTNKIIKVGNAEVANANLVNIPCKNASHDFTLQQIHDKDNSIQTLLNLAHAKGFELQNVPGDGNCLFHAVSFQLDYLGMEPMDAAEIRSSLVQYLTQNPVRPGTGHYQDFLASPTIATTADTEQPTDLDFAISLLNAEDAKNQRWERYLDRLQHGAYGDHICLTGIADMLNVNVAVIATLNPNTHLICPHVCKASQTMNIGLIGQVHYVSLHRLQSLGSLKSSQYILKPQTHQEEQANVYGQGEVNNKNCCGPQ
jgi:hypothetical protein